MWKSLQSGLTSPCTSSRGLQRLSGVRRHGKLSTCQLPAALKERIAQPIANTYEPSVVESGWQDYWHSQLSAKVHDENEQRKTFSMLLPPPNITGALHIGHALTATIQDTLARWHRMQGDDVLWVPGLDHAGIATQTVVEKKLWKESKLTRHDVGRQKFIDHVLEWNDQYGSRILTQLERIGALLNKDNTFFTLDEPRSKAVIDAFVRLHEKDLIYRSRRIINWCPILNTAISEIEVDSVPVNGSTMLSIPNRDTPVEVGVMYRLLYPVFENQITESTKEMQFVQVDTTRPETILGDVALAIHPDDPRYTHLHNKHVIHPFTREKLPIVLDSELVNIELGTGVVKVTPAHDANDFNCGLRHNLSEKVVIDKNGKMSGDIEPKYIGMDRFDARLEIVQDLIDKELFVSKIDHPTTISICSRSGTIIEPRLMPQWFIKCDTLALKSSNAVKSGNLVIEPAHHNHTWFNFLDNAQDWCISRQLWWGHQIPAFQLKLSSTSNTKHTQSQLHNQWIVTHSIEKAHENVYEKYGLNKDKDYTLVQDEDVLDTWFSSALLPLSALAWPESDAMPKSIRKYYPLSVMETGFDILFFWVARMSMLCTEFSKKQPFKQIYLHPMVRDKSGRKMSKSLGNVIDPTNVIDGVELSKLLDGLMQGNMDPKEVQKASRELKREFPKGIPTCGADALRFTLASYLQQGHQINMDIQRVVSNRHFCNKMWNAVKYALPMLDTAKERTNTNCSASVYKELVDIKPHMGLAERYLFSKMANAVISCNEGLETFHLASSANAIQRFFVNELCDVYIEFSKPVLYGHTLNQDHQRCALATLHTSLDVTLRLLHPFMPFVTEELWQRIKDLSPVENATANGLHSIIHAPYPKASEFDQWIDLDADESMQIILDVMHAVRSLKHTRKILAPDFMPHDNMTDIIIQFSDVQVGHLLQRNQKDIMVQCRTEQIEIVQAASQHSNTMKGMLVHSISKDCQVYLAVPQDHNTSQRIKAEISKLQKRALKSEKTVQMLISKRNEANYKQKVPEAIQVQDGTRLTQAQLDADAIAKSVKTLTELLQ